MLLDVNVSVAIDTCFLALDRVRDLLLALDFARDHANHTWP
jgi:hypothetical protein